MPGPANIPNVRLPLVSSKDFTINNQWLRFFLDFFNNTTASVVGSGYTVQTPTGPTVRSITGTSDKIDVTNGTGVSGNTVITISSTYLGQTSITTVGTITTGTWTGTTIALANGGTGSTTASGARTNLGLGTIATQNSNNVTITGGTVSVSSVSATTVTGGSVLINEGSSASTVKAGGTSNVNTTSVGNVGAGEDDLMTFSLPASSLSTNGDYIEIHAWGTTASNANNKQIKIYFGSTALFTSSNSGANNIDWSFTARVIRTAAATQESICDFLSEGTFTNGTNRTTPAETLSNSITIKCTGTATSDNDIVQRGLIVKWFPNN